MTKRNRRSFTSEFKKQIVQLYEGGKPRQEIIREYGLTSSSFDRWVSQYHDSVSFKEADNRSPEEKELIKLRKETTSQYGERHFKASGGDHGTKVDVIRNNRHNYSVSAPEEHVLL